MKQIVLTITAEAPLAIGQQKPGGSVSEALDYIPGSVIRGAIAAKILAEAGSEPGLDADGSEDDFHKLFLGNHAAVFQNAYPAIAKIDRDEQVEPDKNENEYILVPGEICLLPATALSSKTDSGFKIHKTDGTIKKVGVFDSLIDSFCAREHEHFYEPNDLKGDRVEPFKGFYSQQDRCYRSHTISKRLLTRG